MNTLLLLSLCAASTWALPLKQLSEIYAVRHPNTETEPNPEYGDLFQGDIDLDGEDPNPGMFNAIWNLNRRWTANTLYYTIDSAYSADQRSRIMAGIDEIIESTKVNGQMCVDLLPRTSQTNYVFVEKYSGCTSYVGMIRGAQRLSLVDACVTAHGTIMHEFLHAFGYYHEHSRADRDDYIYVNYDNIQPGYAYAFDKLVEGVEVDHMGTPYDYTSVMHYGAYGFAIDTSIPTIIPLDPDAEIGQRQTLSDLDIERVQIFYCCLNPLDSKYHKHMAGAMRDYC